jgi:hypothetical protein
LARLQIESVPLDFLDNVLLKDLTLEAPERVLNCFTVLNVDLGQRITSFMANDETSMLTVSRCPRTAAEFRFPKDRVRGVSSDASINALETIRGKRQVTSG